MNREKFAWLVSVLLIASLAFQIPSLGRRDRDDDYAFVRTLLDVHRQVASNYVEAVDEQKLQEGAIDGMLGQLDPFTTYVPPAKQEQFDNMLEGSFRGVGIELNQTQKGEVQVVTPIDNSPAARAGVEPGDIIVKVNGDDVTRLKIEEVMKKIKGPIGTPVTLTVRHDNGKEQTLTMNREDIVVPTIKGYRRRPDAKSTDADPWDYWVSANPKIGYVRVTQFTSDTFESLKKVMANLLAQHMRGLVLDLRFNPGGRLDQAKDVINLFVQKGVIVRVKGRNRPEETFYANAQGTLPNFPMVVLVNEHSASASEIVSGSLKDNRRALIVGTRTYGKGSVQELIQLENHEGELKLTVAYYYLPSGRLVHRKKDSTDWGVDPQWIVPMNQDQEKALMQQELDLDVIGGHPPTRPSTRPATQPIDPQLDAALSALDSDIQAGGKQVVPAIPATQPTAKR